MILKVSQIPWNHSPRVADWSGVVVHAEGGCRSREHEVWWCGGRCDGISRSRVHGWVPRGVPRREVSTGRVVWVERGCQLVLDARQGGVALLP
jgi:hypothetical protein